MAWNFHRNFHEFFYIGCHCYRFFLNPGGDLLSPRTPPSMGLRPPWVSPGGTSAPPGPPFNGPPAPMGLTGGGPPPHPDPPSMAGINHAQMCKIRASAIQARFALETFRRLELIQCLLKHIWDQCSDENTWTLWVGKILIHDHVSFHRSCKNHHDVPLSCRESERSAAPPGSSSTLLSDR